MSGEDLGAEGLAEHDLVDRFADDLLEADMWTPPGGVEIDETLETAWQRSSARQP
jgi:ADP-ribose pyrophosphatase YjhB (NUDIX family)